MIIGVGVVDDLVDFSYGSAAETVSRFVVFFGHGHAQKIHHLVVARFYGEVDGLGHGFLGGVFVVNEFRKRRVAYAESKDLESPAFVFGALVDIGVVEYLLNGVLFRNGFRAFFRRYRALAAARGFFFAFAVIVSAGGEAGRREEQAQNDSQKFFHTVSSLWGLSF